MPDMEHPCAYGDPRAVCMRWAVPPDCHGKTAAEVLAHKVRRLGIERARSVVASGDVRVDGNPVVPEAPLPKGTVLELWRLPPDDPADLRVPPRVLFAGDGLVVLDKPGDLAVHPSARYLHNTVTAWLRLSGYEANPCHRLDRETSGVLVCAAPGDAERQRKTAFMNRAVDKAYLAVVRGLVRAPFSVDAPLALQGERGLVRIRMVPDPAGQPCLTDVEPVLVDEASHRSVVRCHPRTGRQHQIRAHVAHAGFPIVGDKLYAMGDVWFDRFTRRALAPEELALLDHPRQALHAERVTFTDDGLTFSSPLPEELASLVAGALPG